MSPIAEVWDPFWKITGLIGQSFFALRFLVQWYHSEKAHRSVIPLSFWYISVIAGWILLLYSIYRLDPVFIIGFVVNFLIYLRNLDLVYRARSRIQRLQFWLIAQGEQRQIKIADHRSLSGAVHPGGRLPSFPLVLS